MRCLLARKLISLPSTMYNHTRSSPRVVCQARFVGAGATTLRGEVHDVSRTGLCLTVDHALEPGKELHLEFDLPTGRVAVVGEVRRATQLGRLTELGIRFVRISADAQAVLEQALAPTRAGIWWQPLPLRR